MNFILVLGFLPEGETFTSDFKERLVMGKRKKKASICLTG